MKAFAFFLALALVFTWPLAIELTTAVADPGDPLINTFIVDWVCHALAHQPLRLYDAPVFHPAPLPLAYSENLIAVALLVLPFHLAGAPPIAVYNIALLLGFALSGFGAYLLARRVSGSTFGALLGGTFFAFCAYKFDHLSHLQIIFSAWVPLTLYALLLFWERVTWKRAALLALMLVLNGLTNIYFLMFCGVASFFTIAVLAAIEPRGRRFFAALALTIIAAALVLFPFLQPYRIVSKHYKLIREPAELNSFTAKPIDWLVSSSSNWFYNGLADERLYEAEKKLFPGLVIVALAIGAMVWTRREQRDDQTPERVRFARTLNALILIALALAYFGGIPDRFELKLFDIRLLSLDSADIPLMAALLLTLVRFRKALRVVAARSRFSTGAWAAAIWILIGILGTFGLQTFVYNFFYLRFEPFQAMRVPARFAVIAYAGLAVWAALGAAAITNTKWRAFIAIALLLDLYPRFQWEHVPRDVAPVYRWLKAGPVLELPVWGNGIEYHYMRAATEHHVPIVNGTSGFAPAEAWKTRDAEQRNAYDELLAMSRVWRVRYLLVHRDALTPEKRTALDEMLRRNNLPLVRRFGSDEVYAVR